jgi:energy-coupling factor transport system permease protein
MILGQYVPLDSPIHNLNPTLKLVLLLAVMTTLLAFKLGTQFALIGILWLLTVLLSRLSPVFVLKGLRPILFLLVLTFVMHCVLTDGKTVLLDLGLFTLTQEGLSQASFFTGRLAMLVAFTSLLTLTTSAVELSFAIEQLTKPLTVFGFPSGEFAMMLTIALRFIPVLFREMDKILKAQTCRGAPFSRGSPMERAKAYLSILVPLFLNSFNRALELATAMEIRGYDPGAPRGQYRRHPFGARDVFALLLVSGVLVLALLTPWKGL